MRETEFSVELTFDNVLEKLVVPFTAIKGFFDPAVQFGLQFETRPPEAEGAEDETADEAAGEPPPAQAAKAGAASARNEPGPAQESEGDGPKVVSLDQFRKK